jgi:hypothetical protein
MKLTEISIGGRPNVRMCVKGEDHSQRGRFVMYQVDYDQDTFRAEGVMIKVVCKPRFLWRAGDATQSVVSPLTEEYEQVCDVLLPQAAILHREMVERLRRVGDEKMLRHLLANGAETVQIMQDCKKLLTAALFNDLPLVSSEEAQQLLDRLTMLLAAPDDGSIMIAQMGSGISSR